MFPAFLILAAVFTSLSINAFAQSSALLKQTTYKTENMDFGVAGTISIIGAPSGAITIEGWQKNEVEISAEIEVQGANSSDLAELTKVSGFVIDESFGHIRISSVGTYDKKYLKSVAKKFPKHLLELPLKIDYRIKVPMYCDLNIDGGRGDFVLSGVEGAIQIKFLESSAKLNLLGGAVFATFGKGAVDVKVPDRNWRGRGADIQLAEGTMTINLPPNLSAYVDAKVLRTGKIENNYDLLKPRDRTKFTDRLIAAKSVNGGAQLSFTVGDGILKIASFEAAP